MGRKSVFFLEAMEKGLKNDAIEMSKAFYRLTAMGLKTTHISVCGRMKIIRLIKEKWLLSIC